MIIRKKHKILFILLFILTIFIFYINFSWGNPVWNSFSLAIMSSILIFLTFAFFWELNDFWQFRWHRMETSQVNIKKMKIPLAENSSLYGEYITEKSYNEHQNSNQIEKENRPLVIFIHGFSDNSVLDRYITIPLSLNGFEVLSYDNRGTKRSSNAGSKSDFMKIVKDLGVVLDFVQSDKKMREKDLYLVGLSLGAISAIFQGLKHPFIKKIIAVSAMAQYNTILPKSPVPFKGKWWLWLRYRLLGVPTNPKDRINQILSPFYQVKEKRKEFLSKRQNTEKAKKEWKEYINQKLFLIHSKNDKVVPYQHFKRNVKITQINNNNTFVVDAGGHNFVKCEPSLIAKIINFLNR